MAKTLKLSDYKKSDYIIPEIDISFDLHEEHAIVVNKMKLNANPEVQNPASELVLNGEHLELQNIKLNDIELTSEDYILEEKTLTIKNLKSENFVEITTKIYPHKNTDLEGLYKSGNIFCTQNEAEGFRRITYFLDRPDIMSSFVCHIEADKNKYPFLLSNGDCISKEDLGNGRHKNSWKDPHKKPCYLFALVAGDLCLLEDTFTTKSGRKVALEIYSDHGMEDRLDYSMQALKDSMKWDEERFDLEYDLNTYMIVAVDAFNAGAMENKGLNIFNTKFVLAKPSTATDNDYYGIQSVIGHEYFHNWTGNRVTCRDWFQLSLKEGLTVFRDQEFSADLNSRPVERINSVIRLRSHQFAEDGGPTAHPIRPEEVINMNNFYTLTVYEKGAEVIRMQHTLLGEENFQKAMKLYFERHDGSAATCEDFVSSMEDASGVDLKQFRNWYSQAGTPEVKVETEYDSSNKKFHIHLSQSTPATPKQETKLPFHIPVVVGLLDNSGNEISASLNDNMDTVANGTLLHLKEAKQSFTFDNVSEEPKLSILRNFSAPVKLIQNEDMGTLKFLAANDTDYFNRWESIFSIAKKSIISMVEDIENNKEAKVLPELIEAYDKTLDLMDKDADFASLAIELPDTNFMKQQFSELPAESLIKAYEITSEQIGLALEEKLKKAYDKMKSEAGEKFGLEYMGQHKLQKTALEYLCATNKVEYIQEAQELGKAKINMTMEIASLSALQKSSDSKAYFDAAEDFYQSWKEDELVLNKYYFTMSYTQKLNALDTLKKAMSKPTYDLKTPNKVYNSLRTFGASLSFHAIGEDAYNFYTDKLIEVDKINAQVSARLASNFEDWKQQKPENQKLLKACLERISNEKLSDNCYEIIQKCLDA